jgi:NADP-dependent 3-hydroxy acid dehydrogenase YdfG
MGSTLLSGSTDEWASTFNVNVLGLVRTLQTFVPVMVAQRDTKSVVEITASAAGVVFGNVGRVHTFQRLVSFDSTTC